VQGYVNPKGRLALTGTSRVVIDKAVIAVFRPRCRWFPKAPAAKRPRGAQRGRSASNGTDALDFVQQYRRTKIVNSGTVTVFPLRKYS